MVERGWSVAQKLQGSFTYVAYVEVQGCTGQFKTEKITFKVSTYT